MFKIVSDSPYVSKRKPLPDGQVRLTVRATTVGKKKTIRSRKTTGKNKEQIQS